MLKELAYVLIKFVIIPSHNPAENLVDLGISALSAPIKFFSFVVRVGNESDEESYIDPYSRKPETAAYSFQFPLFV